MTYDPSRKNVAVHTKQNTSRLWTTDEHGARTAVGTRHVDDLPQGIIVRTSWSSLSTGTGDYTSPATDNTWLNLPVGRFPVPSLRRVTLVKWDILGDYANPLGDAESIEAQLMVDGVAVDSALAYAQTAAVAATGVLRFTAELTSIGNLTSPRFLMSTKMQIVSAAGASVIATEKFILSTINSRNDQLLSWRLRKTATGGGTTVVMSIHSVLCYQLCPTSGV